MVVPDPAAPHPGGPHPGGPHPGGLPAAVDDLLSVEAADIVERPSAWKRLARNWSVRIGGAVLVDRMKKARK